MTNAQRPQTIGTQRREYFIPIRRKDLVDFLCREPSLTAQERQEFRELSRLLAAVFHFEYHRRLEQLKDAYSLFDPDADTVRLGAATGPEQEQRINQFMEDFKLLLERANFRRLSREDIGTALQAASAWGLNLDVDFSVFDRLEIFARGDAVGKRWRRRWGNLKPPEEIELPIYQRLVVVLRLRETKSVEHVVDTQSLFIKVFKDIPKLDLEMLLPGTRVKLSMTDRGRIVLPALSGTAITVWKIFQGALTFALAGAYGLLAFLGLVGGTVGYGLRSFYGYLQTKQKYQLNLTQSLYYQNLDNNAGALFRLLDEAEEQECREALLAYFFLWRWAGKEGWTIEQLDRAIENYLDQQVSVRCDFEIQDAIAKLARLNLVQRTTGGPWRALPVADALSTLDATWDSYFSYDSASKATIPS